MDQLIVEASDDMDVRSDEQPQAAMFGLSTRSEMIGLHLNNSSKNKRWAGRSSQIMKQSLGERTTCSNIAHCETVMSTVNRAGLM